MNDKLQGYIKRGILNKIMQNPEITIEELARKTSLAVTTIEKKLIEMEEEGMISEETRTKILKSRDSELYKKLEIPRREKISENREKIISAIEMMLEQGTEEKIIKKVLYKKWKIDSANASVYIGRAKQYQEDRKQLEKFNKTFHFKNSKYEPKKMLLEEEIEEVNRLKEYEQEKSIIFLLENAIRKGETGIIGTVAKETGKSEIEILKIYNKFVKKCNKKDESKSKSSDDDEIEL